MRSTINEASPTHCPDSRATISATVTRIAGLLQPSTCRR
jgi:hypothetical protein